MFERALVDTLVTRMSGPRQFIQVIAGPRQTGKSTAIAQMSKRLIAQGTYSPAQIHTAMASQELSSTRTWLESQWNQARAKAQASAPEPALLIIDEIQMVSQWSAIVKRLWDEDTLAGTNLHVVLTGSSALLLQHGLAESLLGRFEMLRCLPWDYAECREAFGLSLDEYLYFGGYPGALQLRSDEERWFAYMRDAIVAPSVDRDVIALQQIQKPALMRALFTLGASLSGQEVSYTKLLGQLDDAGNSTTIAGYLKLLDDAGLLADIQKYSPNRVSSRRSSPRLACYDTGLMVACHGPDRATLLSNSQLKGHLVESAVGAYLLRRARKDGSQVFWWRNKAGQEVDFVVVSGQAVTAIEVKSGGLRQLGGIDAFVSKYPSARPLVIGSPQCPLEDFLAGNIPLFTSH